MIIGLKEIEEFINFYFIKPILFYEGYNLVNTFTYATLALLGIYVIYKFLEKNKIEIKDDFFLWSNWVCFVWFLF